MKDLRRKYKLDRLKHNNNFTFGEVLFITLTFGLVVASLTTFIVVSITKNQVFDSSLQDIISSYKEITKTYYEDVDKEKLADSAIDGMFNYLGEDYSKLLDENGANKLTDSLTDNYKGVGIQIYSDGTNYIIYDVVKNSSAASAGLKKDDIVKEINGTTIKGDMTYDEVSSLITSSSKVEIKILRDNKETYYTLTVSTINLPVVSSKVFTSDNKTIGYIYLESFTSNAYKQFKDELELLEHRKINSLIIDLRDNTGGYLSQAESIASLFLRKGKKIYSLEGKDLNKVSLDETEEKRDYDVVILINEYTASASEVLSLALKESYGAILVGTKSYGKGKVQATSTLSDDAMIKYTTAKWLSPSGKDIDGVGIEPGIYVEQNYNFLIGLDDNDSQLEKAKEYLFQK